jgi:hypothetical protein
MPENTAESTRESAQSGPMSSPKVFISYSWTTPQHKNRVRLLAERLIQDGVEVVLDIYDLKEGHDKYSFMERMVTDSNITHVLVICDRLYAQKADAKKSGVGTESQIISKEVYEKVNQSKFIPLVCEFSENGEPCLPVFFKSRIWMDFSSLESENENWERLIRLLFGKPEHQRPVLGRPPAYVTSNQSIPTNPSSGKLNTLKQAFLQNKKGLKLYRSDFLSACIEYADSLRIRGVPQVESMGEKVLEDCSKLKVIRNEIVEWVVLESETNPGNEFEEALLNFLERLRELKSRPAEVNQWNDSWFEAQSVFVYETFLYIVAALLKTECFAALHEVFTSYYLRPETERYSNEKFERFGCFWGQSGALQAVLGTGDRRLFSPAAELMKRQADRQDLPFSAVVQAELLVFLMVLITSDVRWYPQTLFYASSSNFPFFVRATQHKHFLKLASITGISEADALRDAVKSGYERLGVNSWYDFAMSSDSFWNQMNMDKLDSLK